MFGDDSKPEKNKVVTFSDNEKLAADGGNFMSWKAIQVRILKMNEWYGVVSGLVPKPHLDDDINKYLRWNRMDDLAQTQLALNMDRGLYHQLSQLVHTSKELWDVQEKRFASRGSAKAILVGQQLQNKRIRPGESMKDHIAEMRSLWSEYLECKKLLTS